MALAADDEREARLQFERSNDAVPWDKPGLFEVEQLELEILIELYVGTTGGGAWIAGYGHGLRSPPVQPFEPPNADPARKRKLAALGPELDPFYEQLATERRNRSRHRHRARE